MPTPISQYGYEVNELEVKFTSLSLNTTLDTEYLWDFGDGNTSDEEDVTYIYTSPAFYNVKLTVINLGELPSESSNLVNLSGVNNPAIFNNIELMIDLYSPKEIIGTIRNHQQKEFLINKWQAYLQPLLFNPEVSIEDTYNISAYSPLANSLVA